MIELIKIILILDLFVIYVKVRKIADKEYDEWIKTIR